MMVMAFSLEGLEAGVALRRCLGMLVVRWTAIGIEELFLVLPLRKKFGLETRVGFFNYRHLGRLFQYSYAFKRSFLYCHFNRSHSVFGYLRAPKYVFW